MNRDKLIELIRFTAGEIEPIEINNECAESILIDFEKQLLLNGVSSSLPTRKEMDKEIIAIMSDNLHQEDGMICNKFETSLKIVDYIEKITGNES
jgi:hypothetical protein